MRIRAQAVIDASGRSALLLASASPCASTNRSWPTSRCSPTTPACRAPTAAAAGDIRIVARADLGWFWMIPISDELMSVGRRAAAATSSSRCPRSSPRRCSRSSSPTRPLSARLMAHAERRWPVRVERDFSYGARAYAGDRWILAGDAGLVPRPGVLDRRGHRAGVGARGRTGRGGRDWRAATSPPARSAGFDRRQRGAVSVVPPLRARLLHARVPRSVLQPGSAPAACSARVITVLCRLLAAVAGSRACGSALFFLSVRLQARFGVVPSHLDATADDVRVTQQIADEGRAAATTPERSHERCERAKRVSHANGASRRSGERESVSGSPRGEAPRLRP